MAEDKTNEENSQLVGLLAQFDDPNSLLEACNQCRESGYQSTDAYSPFPVHGIDPALGIKRSILPMIVLCVGITGLFVGLGLQLFANSNAFDALSPFKGYGYFIGGKPIFSVPANIPVTFEIIVLSSAFATFLGMWFLNRLPMFSNPLHRISRFKRATNDKFFLMINADDEKFDRTSTESQLNQWGAVAVEECRQDLTDTQLPKWLSMAGVLLAILLLLPPVMIFRAKGMVNRAPRLHFNPDMDWQIKSKPQTVSPITKAGGSLFSDNRVMRQPVAGSIAAGDLQLDTEYFQGIKQGSERPSDDADDLSVYVSDFPADVTVDSDLLTRGKLRFEIYCSVCHGYAGQGNGLVNQRAVALAQSGKATWTTAKSLHNAVVKDPKQNPVGRLFDTISHGRGTMGPYRDQISTADRWAIVAYVKALQETGLPEMPATGEKAESPKTVEPPAEEVKEEVKEEAEEKPET
jgi:mono/diheme cytochrome c family protein